MARLDRGGPGWFSARGKRERAWAVGGFKQPALTGLRAGGMAGADWSPGVCGRASGSGRTKPQTTECLVWYRSVSPDNSSDVRATQTIGGFRGKAGLRRRDIIATLHLICGLPCSGKTTLAKTIEVERRALRLSPDEWITTLYGSNISGEALDAARDPVETALWKLGVRVLVLGLDVILEFGFWSRSEREDFRRRATQLGARSELHFTDAPNEELIRRLAQRNAALPPGTFWIDETQLRSWFDIFEPPSSEELRPRETANQT